jgi:pimeloyl-ACP methyl ester carboxylesterase
VLTQVSRRRIQLPDSGIEIALLDWGGDGPLALLHHANGYCAAAWAPVAERLRDHYRVVAMDARGHGDSSKPVGAENYHWVHFGRDLIGVAEQLATAHPDQKVALGLGHSLGGAALLLASAERPDLFGCQVWIDPVIPPPDPARPESRWRRSVDVLIQGALKRRHVWPSRRDARLQWLEKKVFADWDPQVLDLYLAEGLLERADGQVELKCPGVVEAAIFEASLSVDLWPIAQRVRVQTLIQWAKRGDFTRRAFERLVDCLADARVVDVDSGHLVPMERPDLVVEAVLEFAPPSR